MIGSVHSSSSEQAARAVVVYPGNAHRSPGSHERATCSTLAKRLADILGYRFAGEFDATHTYADRVYFVPTDTFVSLDAAARLGIRGEHDLFGGVVPHPFVATKTITHPLFSAQARAPDGWSFSLAPQLHDVVLPGFSAFSLDDALRAGTALLEHGPVRVKKASGVGGLGQWVATDAGELDACLRQLDAQEIAHDGLVCELNLARVETLSVGQVRAGDLLATYCGMQRLTPNNAGEEVYGGSDLTVARGDFDVLLGLRHEATVLTAVRQARTYHAAVMQSFPAMFASRCNYDVAHGFDNQGRHLSGVLEQSWRIGGASGAEILALGAFRADPTLRAVRAATVEIYGNAPAVPADAVVYFQGTDAQVGPLTKYARLTPYADP
jgi:hypothetical protein